MKRFFASVLISAVIFCLVSCSVPLKNSSSRQNGLNSAFSADMTVNLDRLQAEGTLSRLGAGVWNVEFSAPDSLSGVKLEFSEGNVNASYKGLSFSVPQSAVPVKAMLINLIKAVDDNAASEQLKGSEKDDLLEIKGKLDGGEYTLTVDKDGRLSAFEMPNNSLKMEFSNISDSSAPVTEVTQAN